MRTSRSMLVVLALLAVGCSAGASADPPAAQPAAGVTAAGITVVGTGRVVGRPDTLRATIGVEVTRPTVAAAVADASTAAEQVTAALRDAGVAAEDIQTVEFAVRPEYTYVDGERPRITGYTTSHLFAVRIGTPDRAGEVLQAAVDAGGDALRLHEVRFAVEEAEALLATAREQAFADARTRAEQYAQLAGRTLGELVSVVEEVGTPGGPPLPFAAAFVTDVASIPLEAGQAEVVVRVTAVWALD